MGWCERKPRRRRSECSAERTGKEEAQPRRGKKVRRSGAWNRRSVERRRKASSGDEEAESALTAALRSVSGGAGSGGRRRRSGSAGGGGEERSSSAARAWWCGDAGEQGSAWRTANARSSSGRPRASGLWWRR